VVVVLAEAAEEAGVGEDSAPAPAHERCAGKGRGLRREAEEDLLEEDAVVQYGGGGGASHSGEARVREYGRRLRPVEPAALTVRRKVTEN
jgi:hypothetical protein